MKNNLRAIFSALFGIAVFLFWLLGYPEALNYQEQNQLFLTTTDYFLQRMEMIRDNMSDLPTAEAFWRLGMVNSAKRYMTDIQQSILNARQSGRCTKRIAECHIVNGDYKAAEKRLNILKNTIFYKSWAEEAETYLFNDAKVNSHETWGKLRRYRYKDSFLYSYPEKHKMLGLLFQHNTDNRLALSYFMGQLLLDGEFNSFMG